jgi:hypothetical protein
VYFALTIIGAAFRGHAQALVPPNHVPNLDEDPHIQRQVPPPQYEFAVFNDPVRSGTHA